MACGYFPHCDCIGFCQKKQQLRETRGPAPNPSRFGAQWSALRLHGQDCEYCGVTMDLNSQWRHPTRDHVVPRSKGGTNAPSNLVRACRACNETKGNNRLLEWVNQLREAGDPRAERVERLMARLPKELV